MNIHEKYKTLLLNNGINTPLRQAHFLAQLEHESGFKAISENLNYSAKGLMTTFKKYFPTLEIANAYQRQPKKIANRVYANRMGNGSEASGDGFLFRGRGFIQITGKDNYAALSKDTKIDFLKNPDFLLDETNAMISALWFWNKNKLNSFADLDNIETITKRINGGFIGLEHRKECLKKWKKILGI
jgi:putative chitinase